MFTVGSNVYTVDGISKTMPEGIPEVKDGRVFIPVREIAEALNLDIDWNSSEKVITITN